MNSSPERFSRVSTGNMQLDAVLGGGFPSNSINIIIGQPGTGKTILAEQLLFANANGDRPLLFLTTLSEPLSKVLSYGQRFRFFDESKVGTSIQYHDLGGLLAAEGPAALGPWLTDAITTSRPAIIVIDSFRAIHDLGATPQDMRRIVTSIAGLLAAYQVTTFLLGEYAAEDIGKYPEFAVGDGVVELARQPLSTRDERFLRVLKLRGSGYREGQHAFRISESGLDLFPRLVSPAVPETYKPRLERVPFGITGLDRMLRGGLWHGSTSLIMGPTGSGKTTLGLQFALEGVRRGEGCLYVHLQENPSQLRRAIAGLGANAADVTAHGLGLYYQSPVELQIDSIIVAIFERIRRGDVQRMVVDAVGDLVTAANDPQRLHNYLYALVQHLAVHGVTTLLTYETRDGFNGGRHVPLEFSPIADNVLLLALQGEERSRRTVRVIKTRNSGHEPDTRELQIDDRGVHVV